jgi:type VI secretion system protein
MPGATLLSRIRSPQGGPAHAPSDRELRASILENLAHMCGTRLGTMLTCPDYGIADVSEMIHAFPEAIQLMGNTLRHTIRTYEPRLQNVQVVHVPSEGHDLTLRFAIHARVVMDGVKRAIEFETMLDTSRRITVR